MDSNRHTWHNRIIRIHTNAFQCSVVNEHVNINTVRTTSTTIHPCLSISHKGKTSILFCWQLMIYIYHALHNHIKAFDYKIILQIKHMVDMKNKKQSNVPDLHVARQKNTLDKYLPQKLCLTNCLPAINITSTERNTSTVQYSLLSRLCYSDS